MAAVCATVAAFAQDGRFSYRIGFEHTTGDYGGTQEVSDLYAPLTLLYGGERVTFRATIPYLEAEFLDPISADGLPTYTESGPGDVILGATVYDVWRSFDGGLALDLTGEIKLPTADEEQGLGTGETDYTVQADLYKFVGRSTLVGTIGYRLRGEPPGLGLDDSWQVSAGALYRFSAYTSGGLFLDYRQSSIPGAASIREASAYLGWRLGDGWRAQSYLIHGLSDTTLDWGVGASLRRGF
jgi:hypothetical protein